MRLKSIAGVKTGACIGILLMIFGCGLFPGAPENGTAVFVVRGSYAEEDSILQAVPLGKAGAVDRARVLVADLSNFEGIESFWESEIYEQLAQNGYSIETWSEWKRFLTSRNLNIFSEQILIIEGDYATGRASGVVGLNLIILVFEEDGVITDFGYAAAVGEENGVNTVDIEMSYRM
jgi:hypothetical protein